MTTAPEETLDLLRRFLAHDGASLRLYHVAGSFDTKVWQCALSWDTQKGIDTGFHVGTRQDPVEALADICRHALTYQLVPAEKDEKAVAIATSVSKIINVEDVSIDDLLG